jgi:hypothetical protein
MFFFVLGCLTALLLKISLLWRIHEYFKQKSAINSGKIASMVEKISIELEQLRRQQVDWISIRELQRITVEPRQFELWNRALKYLEENDHRYLFGIKNIKSEDLQIIFTKSNGERINGRFESSAHPSSRSLQL